MQGLAFLVTFAAIGKSDWPRAAIERARRKRQCLFSKSKDQAQSERARYAIALTPGLRRGRL